MDDPAAAASTIAPPAPDPVRELAERFPETRFAPQETRDEVPTMWVDPAHVHDVLSHLRHDAEKPYRMLYDLTAVDERAREHREGMPESDFTVVYHLLSYERNADVRLKVALKGDEPSIGTITDLWPAASWYEREVWDLFGVRFRGHPHLRRLLLPPTWKGHPLRKDHPARATEMGPFEMPDDKWLLEEEALQFRPEDWGLERKSKDGEEFLFLNIGPQHPGTHGVLRLVLQLDGEVIRDCVPDIGFHHRGAEKMGERQTWHTYIPYTDRIDYLSGVQNNLAYLLAVEKLAGIEVPERALVIRILVCELYRLASHLVWYGTFAQDVGALSPVFFMFTDRERIFEICEAITGGRMHPSWFRIGGVQADLPEGWEDAVRNLVKYLRRRIREYDGMVLNNTIFKRRNVGVGAYSLDEAIDWGVTGPGLRACGLEWDFRKKRPYGGYDRFEFDVPTATGGDGYARALVRVEEMRQSLRILEQCVERMPGGPVKSDHPLTTPPRRQETMHDIETLIHHFLSVSWGPVIPPGEAHAAIEAPKGYYGYWLTSDGGIHSYRTRIRAPSFPHMQMVPLVSKGMLVADLLAYLGSLDFVLADIDR